LKSLNYSTGGASANTLNIAKKLKELHIRSKENPDKSVDRNLYKLMSNLDLLKLAYENLKSKPGNPETFDGMSIEILEKIIVELQTERFKFKAGIPKVSGGSRSLTNKIVQEAMRMILEAIYEPVFVEASHGTA
jgi:RNA-directed DNA polymerase